jgi:hypothetical protein
MQTNQNMQILFKPCYEYLDNRGREMRTVRCLCGAVVMDYNAHRHTLSRAHRRYIRRIPDIECEREAQDFADQQYAAENELEPQEEAEHTQDEQEDEQERILYMGQDTPQNDTQHINESPANSDEEAEYCEQLKAEWLEEERKARAERRAVRMQALEKQKAEAARLRRLSYVTIYAEQLDEFKEKLTIVRQLLEYLEAQDFLQNAELDKMLMYKKAIVWLDNQLNGTHPEDAEPFTFHMESDDQHH